MSRNMNTKPKKKKKSKWSVRRMIFWMIITAGTATVCVLVGYALIIFNGQKLLGKIDPSELVMGSPTAIYDEKGVFVANLNQLKSEPVKYTDIPPLMIDAVIATEDKRFNEHTGIDFLSIGRAVVKDIIHRSAVEGGSTITQQLAKNILFENPDKTLFRKATEASLAIALEEQFTKEEIITLYLNRINFGNRSYGIKVAAKRYFDKELKDLELWEMATLAAIPKSPKYYSPVLYPDNSKDRRAVVLKLMFDQGFITEAEKDKANAVIYKAPPQVATSENYLSFIDYTVEEALDKYNIEEDALKKGGYKIYTTMNTKAQKIMEESFKNDKMFQKSDEEQQFQGAMVIVDHKTGGLVAMVGGRDYEKQGLNRATLKQQPGSSFKPLAVYAPAIETGEYNPYSILEDKQNDYNGYKPRNYNNQYLGEVTMFDAVKKSMNQPAVWLLNEIKMARSLKFLKALDIPLEKNDENLAIALGGLTKGATPISMAQAYGSFANNGAMYTAHSILKITLNDEVIETFKADKPKQVMSKKTAWYTTLLLKGVIESGGTGTAAKMNRPVAGKTGSTQLTIKGYEKFTKDLWFVGYTPEWTAAVWMGFDKPDKNHYVTISSGSAAALFKDVMSKALDKVPVTNFVKPSGVPELTEPPKGIIDLTVTLDPALPNKANINWTPIADSAVSYRIYRKSTETEFEMLAEIKNNQAVSDLTIVPGQTYQYYVVTFLPDSNTESNNSNVVDLVVPVTDVSPSPTELIIPSPTDDGTIPVISESPNPEESTNPDETPSPTPTESSTPEPTPSLTPTESPLPTPTPVPVIEVQP
ncbi:PBP1A family penicillin-binding protein [Paenibacillus psychroresistens]|nr:PBP1A family penicillin-binding protein [Paenibacillus psychroresistens]